MKRFIMNFKVIFLPWDLIPLEKLTIQKVLIFLGSAPLIRYWRSIIIAREFDIREFIDCPKLIAKDFNKKNIFLLEYISIEGNMMKILKLIDLLQGINQAKKKMTMVETSTITQMMLRLKPLTTYQNHDSAVVHSSIVTIHSLPILKNNYK